MQTEMSSSPTGGLCLSAGKHAGTLTEFQTKVNKKIKKLATKTQRHEEYSHRGQRLTRILFGHEKAQNSQRKIRQDNRINRDNRGFWPAWCSWQNLLLKPALSQVIAFVHKAIEMAFSEAGEEGVLLATKRRKMHKRDKKMTKKALFLAALFPIEIRTISRIISLKCAEFLVLTGIVVLGRVWMVQ